MYKGSRCVVVQISKPGFFDILIAMCIFVAMKMHMLLYPLAKDGKCIWVGCTWQREVQLEKLHGLLVHCIHIRLGATVRLGIKASQCCSTCEDIGARFKRFRVIRLVEQFEIAHSKTWTCRMMKV